MKKDNRDNRSKGRNSFTRDLCHIYTIKDSDCMKYDKGIMIC